MSRTTLLANSLILSMSSLLVLAIFAYLFGLKSAVAPAVLAAIGAVLFLFLTAIFAIYLSKKFDSNSDKQSGPMPILINETWLLRD